MTRMLCDATPRVHRIATTLALAFTVASCSSGSSPTTVVPDPTPSPAPPVALTLASAPSDTSTGFPTPNGTSIPPVVVALRDSLSRAVTQSGMAVSASLVDQNGAAITGATLAGSGPISTDAAGTATFSALSATSRVGTMRIAFAATGLRTTSLLLRVTSGATSAALTSFVLTADTVVAGASIVASVIPVDASGNKLGAGHTVAFLASGGTSVGTWSAAAFVASDSSYRSTYTGVTPGTAVSASVTVDGVAIATKRTITVKSQPVTPPAADYTFTVNANATYTISRFIYGANLVDDDGAYGGATPPAEVTLNRMGGNRLSAWNWENGYSNAGSDYFFQNDRYMQPNSTAVGDAVRSRAQPSFARGQAFMATIPMLGYVSGDACGCNVGNTDAGRAQRLATHFKISQAFKGAPLLVSPNLNDGFVYQDEFVNWFESVFPGRSTHPTAPVFFSLDNEPDIWSGTHQEIQTNLNDNPATPRLLTYKGISDTSIVYARAIKSVMPNALVFGPAVATYTGISVAGRYPTPDPDFGTSNFFDVYLDRMRAAQTTYGRRLLDVLDFHWYPAASAGAYEITNDYAPQDSANIEARIQAPRSLWDATYTEKSWVIDVTGGPIRLLPRLQAQIAAHYPGTKLSISEYYYGRGGDISGGIAQADILGIFGREGLFAAMLWPNAGLYADPYNGDGTKAYAYLFAAFRMYLNYDGAGGRFGDTGLAATTTNAAATSVYASRDAQGRIVVVAINKTRSTKRAEFAVSGASAFRTVRSWTLSAASATPAKQADITLAGGNLVYAMPAMSVTTLVFVP